VKSTAPEKYQQIGVLPPEDSTTDSLIVSNISEIYLGCSQKTSGIEFIHTLENIKREFNQIDPQ